MQVELLGKPHDVKKHSRSLALISKDIQLVFYIYMFSQDTHTTDKTRKQRKPAILFSMFTNK